MSCLPWPSEEKFLERVLRDCEDELAFSLCRVDPVELCENFLERSIISRESYNRFTSMDHSRIKSQLRLRYLVRLVSEKIKKDPALLENLIAVLDKLEGVPSSLTDKLKQAVLNAKEGLADESEAVRGVSGASMGEAGKNREMVLTTGDVNFLTELLVEVSDVWRNIAISLGLPQHEIKNCKEGDNKISLFQVLGFWIANNSKPTLKKLADTLCSGIVARPAAAEKMTRNFIETTMSKGNTKNIDLAKSKNSEYTKPPTAPRIVSQSLPIKVADGKSTLLQVQASPRESVFYQWKKNDQLLANSSRYSGVDKDILVVRHACQGTEGEYTCQVSLQDKHVFSEPITLTVHFRLAKRRLLNLYSTALEVPIPKDSWPPVVTKAFINLALIKSRSPQSITKNYSVCGDADNIIAVKENISYKNAFSEYKSGELILVEGRPGSGKTTLVHKIIKDWRQGDVLTKSELTFLVTLCLFNKEGQDESLENILQEFYSNESELKKTVATILENDGEGVCFVLDGLDEYSSQDITKSVIPKLLDRKLLPQSMIIVFSRPSATRQVNNDVINKRIEVFGFSKEQISEYIDNFPFEEEYSEIGSSTSRAIQLKEYLHSHPNIHNMCYLPIHAAMICFLLQLSKKISPTQTRVYEDFTLSTIYRHCACQQELNSLKDLKGDHAKYFKNLCHLAYKMTIELRVVISSQELKDQLGKRSSLSEEAGLGLLTICPTLQKTGIHQNYAFLHLTFQEFLAAYYIANFLNESQQIQLLKKHNYMKTMWLFYSGLVICSKQIVHLLFENQYEYNLFHCAFESQQRYVCNELIKYKSQKLEFNEELGPTDLLAVEYVITSSSQPITQLDIDGMSNESIVHLLHEIVYADLHQLQSISIGKSGIYFSIDMYSEGTEVFCEIIRRSIHLKTLHLTIEDMKSSSAKKLTSSINHCHQLLHLSVSYGGNPECIKTFISSLHLNHVQKLSLTFRILNAEKFQALGNSLHHLHTSHLHLKFPTVISVKKV